MHLPKEAFIALAALGWADGNLDADEGAALLRVAAEVGLSGDDLAHVEKATREPVTLKSLPVMGMTRADRVLAYALATWLVRLDGVVTPEEKDSLRDLGDALQLPDGIRTRASAASFEVASLPAGDRPDRYDFKALQSRLMAKLGNVDAELAALHGLDRHRLSRSGPASRDLRRAGQARLRRAGLAPRPVGPSSPSRLRAPRRRGARRGRAGAVVAGLRPRGLAGGAGPGRGGAEEDLAGGARPARRPGPGALLRQAGPDRLDAHRRAVARHGGRAEEAPGRGPPRPLRRGPQAGRVVAPAIHRGRLRIF